MGIITEISHQRNKKRVNIFVDNEFKSGLELETAVKFGLKVGKVIDDAELENIIQESETSSAFNVALNFISAMPKSKFEVKQKLKKKEYSNDIIENTILKLEEYNYINDFEYAKMYISSVSKRSKREISQKLRAKGISADIISELLLEIDDESEEKNAQQYALKYMKNKDINEKSKSNLVANLVRKGYSYDLSMNVLNFIISGD